MKGLQREGEGSIWSKYHHPIWLYQSIVIWNSDDFILGYWKYIISKTYKNNLYEVTVNPY